jgi:hypothetical protein
VQANVSEDPSNTWDGNFIIKFIENWNTKAGNAHRKRLHFGITDIEDKRKIARGFQRLKEGILPDPSIFAADECTEPATIVNATAVFQCNSIIG